MGVIAVLWHHPQNMMVFLNAWLEGMHYSFSERVLALHLKKKKKMQVIFNLNISNFTLLDKWMDQILQNPANLWETKNVLLLFLEDFFLLFLFHSIMGFMVLGLLLMCFLGSIAWPNRRHNLPFQSFDLEEIFLHPQGLRFYWIIKSSTKLGPGIHDPSN